MQVWCDFLFCRPGTIIHIMNVVYLELYWYGITYNLKNVIDVKYLILLVFNVHHWAHNFRELQISF